MSTKHEHHIVKFADDKAIAEVLIKYLDEGFEIVNTATPQEGGVIYILCKYDKT